MTVDVSGLRDMVESYAQQVGDVTGAELERIVKDAAPVASGETRDEITVDVSGGGGQISLLVDSPAEQSSYTDEGTAAHKIEGNPLLAFDMGGSTVIVRSVNHPVTPAQRWFDQPMADYFQQALDIAAAQVSI